MILTILFEENVPFNIEIPENEPVELLKGIITAELRLSGNVELIHKGTVLANGLTSDYGIVNEDIIIANRVNSSLNGSSQSSRSPQMSNLGDLPIDITPEALISSCRDNPALLDQIASSNAPLAGFIRNSNILEIRKYLMSRYLAQHKVQYEHQLELHKIAANPDSEENQRKIAERIQAENIRENMELALENIPESFSQVNMLYIDCEINDIRLRAFVDSGAQTTIMSVSCVERCGLSRLIDTRYSGNILLYFQLSMYHFTS
jgi:DNA damage-inducible protein 1